VNLSLGTRLGAYEILAMIGAGGMGEVYRARDTRLKRDVAIKVIPGHCADDEGRLARFQREAELLAALNHPNIAAIHGVEEADGVKALILELVEGPTLADRLAHGRLPLREALAIARQIVDALDAAHERGIVHRDLKPANIKVRDDGTVKVLDFGLAKALESDQAPSDATVSPTMTSPAMTGAGVILGTAAYMSPEQARGRDVDKRTDIWAFGCVLYDLLAGRPAFAGDTVADTITAILSREPDWSALPASTPASVLSFLRHCLDKDRKRRLRDIGDARRPLDDVAESDTESAPATTVTRSPSRSTRGWTWPAAALVLCLVAAAGGWLLRGSPASAVPDNPLVNAKFSRLTDFQGTETLARISPDGKFVAFLSDRDGEFDIWISQVGTGRFTNLTKDIPPLAPSYVVAPIGFSADGADVWFRLANRIMRIPLIGGRPQMFLGEQAWHPSWSPDGRQLVYQNAVDGDPMFVADASGANARQVFVDRAGIHNHNQVWSTDGRWIYHVHGPDVAAQMDVWRVRVSDGRREQLTRLQTAVTTLAPIDPRTILYVAPTEDGAGPWLWALDVENRLTRRVSGGLEQYTSVAATSDGRRVVATVANPIANLWSVPLSDRPAVDRDLRPFPVPTVRALAPRFRGTSLFYLSARGTGDGLWRLENGEASEVWRGEEGTIGEPPAVSPDGRRVAIILSQRGKRHVRIMSADGSDAQSLAQSIEPQGAADWAPDGMSIVTGGVDPQGPGLFKIAITGDAPVRLVSGVATNPVWSPDGALIVYAGLNIAGRLPLLGVRPDGTPVRLPDIAVSPSTRQSHRFMPNERGLVYLESGVGSASATFSVLNLDTHTTRVLARFDSQGEIRTFDITPDGKQIVFDRLRDNSDIVLIDLPE
jgi:serine/threonine protein kinase